MYNIFKYIKCTYLNKEKHTFNRKKYINGYRKLWINEIKNYCP